jgi:chaperonin GroEL
MRQIAVNAGMPGDVVVEKCKNKEFGFGYNAAINKFEDLRASGVLDPAKVTVNAIENAASIAGLVLTTEVLVTDIPEHKTKGSSNRGGDYDDDDGSGYM